tara:strand:- start:6748 stop:6891 length:144 start_codon:yes stop_codon:yes gene_type:complete
MLVLDIAEWIANIFILGIAALIWVVSIFILMILASLVTERVKEYLTN